jgi:hypothetical protein
MRVTLSVSDQRLNEIETVLQIRKQLTYTKSTPINPQHKPIPYGIGGEIFFPARHPSSFKNQDAFSVCVESNHRC